MRSYRKLYPKDRTDVYVKCIEVLAKCMDFFDKISSKLDSGEYDQDEVDANWNILFNAWKQETMRKFY